MGGPAVPAVPASAARLLSGLSREAPGKEDRVRCRRRGRSEVQEEAPDGEDRVRSRRRLQTERRE